MVFNCHCLFWINFFFIFTYTTCACTAMSSDNDESREVIPRTNPEWTNPSIWTFDVRQLKPEEIHVKSIEFQRAGTSSRLVTVEDFRLTDDLNDFNPVQEDSYGNQRFQLVFDTRRCKPDDIIIRTSGNMLVVYCKYEEKENEISVSREYSRQFMLPKEVNPDLLMSTISADGTLKISAPL